jgi:hypothetical protein
VHGPDGEVYHDQGWDGGGYLPPPSKPPISEWANTAHTAAVDMWVWGVWACAVVAGVELNVLP